MATLFISEHTAGALAGTQAAAWPMLAKQTVPIGAATKSEPFGESTRLIRINVDAACSFEVGPDSVDKPLSVDLTSPRLSANQTEYLIVNPGDRIAVITNS